MIQVSARLPDELVQRIDQAAERLKHTRAEVVRQVLEYYLADLEDLRLGLEALQDPADPILDWQQVKRELLSED